MNRRAFVFGAIAAIALLSCERSPTTPSALLPQRPTIDLPQSIEIVGPRSLAPGTTHSYRAIGTMANGETRDFTELASWRSTNSSVLALSGVGTFTATRVGDAAIQVTYSAGATAEIVVVPAGTFRVTGQVVEADAPGVGIDGALVASEGVSSATTARGGRYSLYGVPANGIITVSRNGYVSQTRTLALAGHGVEHFQLLLAAPRADVSGAYLFSIAIDPGCHSRIPEEFWTRRYTASLRQAGPLIEIVLSGASFTSFRGTTSNQFTARVEPEGMTLAINSYDDWFYYGEPPALSEQTSENTVYSVGGRGSGPIAPNHISGTLQGSVYILDRTGQQWTHYCHGFHGYSFTR
jgi:hypothetical protein